ncbi:M16 family metallopeptidase [Bythopirellula polymerisocia]|uniref:Peptidase M16 inactive domain protein n=1 Tax=Bythopirellula polymerisocia TaxID=2528003 RepID=A0A5C6CJ71_9BACT|nr:pitrilysin family protein [Bythopirellula polymerisocia]TWU22839.1 Peptidase M16 inactive domain protein [Bythopirellula polymerisocia]
MTATTDKKLPHTIFSHRLANGMSLVGEPNNSVQSAAITLLVPCGYSADPVDRLGLASVLCDMVLRGAGSRDSRALINDLEVLGVERGESVGATQTSFSAATLADSLYEMLAIYSDIVRRPHLPGDQLDAGKSVCLQEIYSIDDEPSQRLMIELRRRTYPEPWGRSSHGSEAGIAAISSPQLTEHWSHYYRPNSAILGVAGNFEWEQLVDHVEELFGDWQVNDVPMIVEKQADMGAPHLEYDSNQCHIGIAYPSVPYRDPDYLRAWAAVGVLSGGMSSRLFTEVRERRGLCYTVSASLQTQLDRARVLCYAGTSEERAQETLDVTHAELLRLRDGVLPEELSRLKARIKSGLIMQQESTSSRSGSIAREWYHLGRVRTLVELGQLVDELTGPMINEYLESHPPRDFTFATLGPRPLELPREVS